VTSHWPGDHGLGPVVKAPASTGRLVKLDADQREKDNDRTVLTGLLLGLAALA
jgi:hypothetical protein